MSGLELDFGIGFSTLQNKLYPYYNRIPYSYTHDEQIQIGQVKPGGICRLYIILCNLGSDCVYYRFYYHKDGVNSKHCLNTGPESGRM